MTDTFPTQILLATDGSELHVAHAWHYPGMVEPAPVPTGLFEQGARRILDEEAERIASGGAAKVSQTHLKTDYPVDAIPGLAEELGAGLIVLGSRRRGALGRLVAVGSRGLGAAKRMLLGSVSTKVVRMMEGPVLVHPRTGR